MRRLMVVLIGIAIFLFADSKLTVGQQISGTSEQETARIEGRVASGFTQSPRLRVQSIELFLRDSGRSSAFAKVDESGGFVFENVPVGRVRLRPLFTVGDVKDVSLGSTLTLAVHLRASQTKEVTYFGKGRPVTGRIVLPDNMEPEKLQVQLTLIAPPIRALRGQDGRPTPIAELYGAVTRHAMMESLVDEDGGFRIEHVREGNYRLTASANGQRLRFVGKDKGYPGFPSGQLTVDFMSDGESEESLDLGMVRFERLAE